MSTRRHQSHRRRRPPSRTLHAGPHLIPVVLGKDFAGIVEVVGDSVTRLTGDLVFGVVMKPYLGDGSFAEYVNVTVQYGIERLPDSLDPTIAGPSAWSDPPRLPPSLLPPMRKSLTPARHLLASARERASRHP